LLKQLFFCHPERSEGSAFAKIKKADFSSSELLGMTKVRFFGIGFGLAKT